MSKLVMKNNIKSELSITHADNKPAKSIVGTDIAVAVDTINDFPLDASDGDTVIVRDLNRGGTFIYDSTKVAGHNDGTNFNGWIRQYDGAVNVKWFGANETRTDNEVPIQSAVNISSEVYIPSGEYNTTSAIELNTGSILYGASIKGTTGLGTRIKCANRGFQNSFPSDSIKISNLRITGNNNSKGSDTFGINLYTSASCVIENCYIENFENGLLIGKLQNCAFNNITVGACYTGVQSQDLVTSPYFTVTSFDNVYVAGGSVRGFIISNATNLKMSTCGADGVDIGMYLTNCSQSIIDSFYTELDITYGIVLQACNNISINNSNIFGAQSAGEGIYTNMYIDSCANLDIKNCSIGFGEQITSGLSHIAFHNTNTNVYLDSDILDATPIITGNPEYKYYNIDKDNNISSQVIAKAIMSPSLNAVDVNKGFSSINRSSTGIVDFVFSSPLTSVFYIPLALSFDDCYISITNRSTTGFSLRIINSSGALTNSSAINVIVYI